MSQRTVIERVDVRGASVYLGASPDGSDMYSGDGARVMDWLCDAWRYRFNALRSRRYVLNREHERIPLSEHPDMRSVKDMRRECSWVAAVPAMVIQSPDRIENTQWFSAIARRKTNISHRRKAGRMPSFLARKRDMQTFTCWHNKGQNANYRQVNRNHGIVEIKGQNPQGHRTHGTRFTIRIHVRISQPIREYTAVRVNWTRRTLSFTNPPLPIEHEATGHMVGIDMGCVHAATQSDGRFLDLPKGKLERIDKEIRRRQRAMARKAGLSGKTRRQYVRDGASKRYQREKYRVARLHARKHRILVDVYQKYSTGLVREHDLIVIEALQIANMTRKAKPKPDPQHEGRYLSNGQTGKRGLNRSMRDTGLGLLRVMLEYKTGLTGDCTLVQVNPAYTSQTCNKCKHCTPENRESQAVFRCVNCKHEDNADINAALNILQAGLEHSRSAGSASREPNTQDPTPINNERRAVFSRKPQSSQ